MRDSKKTEKGGVERNLLLARLLELPEFEQLQVHEVLSEALDGRIGREPERVLQARQRDEAVKAMREASAYLGLEDGRAPSVEEFKQAARETNLRVGFRVVYQAFDRQWALARRYYEELSIPRSAALRAIQREVRRAGGLHDPVVGLRIWLAEAPAGITLHPSDYKAWAVERNEGREAGEPRFLETSQVLLRRLGMSWSYALRVAKGQESIEEARTAYKRALLASAGEFVPLKLLRKLLDDPGVIEHEGFPRPVMRFRGELQWPCSDIRAYESGQRFFGQGKRDARSRYMDAQEVADTIGMARSSLLSSLRARRPNYYRVPRPSGSTGNEYYWARDEVRSWLAARREHEEYRRSLQGLGRPLANRRKRRTG